MTNTPDSDDLAATRRGRLQREPDFTGTKLTTFTEVVLRHGLPGATIGLLLLMSPTARGWLLEALGGDAVPAEVVVTDLGSPPALVDRLALPTVADDDAMASPSLRFGDTKGFRPARTRR